MQVHCPGGGGGGGLIAENYSGGGGSFWVTDRHITLVFLGH